MGGGYCNKLGFRPLSKSEGNGILLKILPPFFDEFQKVKPRGPWVLSTLGPQGFTFSKFIEKWGKYSLNSDFLKNSTPPPRLGALRGVITSSPEGNLARNHIEQGMEILILEWWMDEKQE